MPAFASAAKLQEHDTTANEMDMKVEKCGYRDFRFEYWGCRYDVGDEIKTS